jgi:hypothetical protein
MNQIKGSSIRSNVVAVTDSLSKRLEAARGSGRLWQVLAIGAGFFGALGIGASYVMERKRNSTIASNQMDVLAQYYRFQVGATLGMSPEKVKASDLQLAAQINPALSQAINKVKTEKKDADRFTAMSSGGMLLAGGMIPGVSGFAKVGVDLVGGVVGGAASSLFSKDVLHVNDMVEHIDGKLKAGQPIDTMDIMLLRAAQDENWQKQFKERYKTPFHKMNPQTQQQVMASMPEMLVGAEKQAYALNKGLISPQSLVMEGPQTASNFAGNMERRAAGGSFVNAETSRRLAAAQQQTSLN